MQQFLFTVSSTEEERLDKYLTRKLPEVSRSQIQKLIDDGYILVNSNIVKSNYKLKINDLIKADLPKRKPKIIKAENIPLDILYEDEDLLVINKAKGMTVHPAAGNYSATLVNALLAHCRKLSDVHGQYRPGFVHRIDKDTSGILIVAKDNEIHQNLMEQLKERTMKRLYIALTEGVIMEPGGIIDAPIGRHPIDRKRFAVTAKNSKVALTKYLVQERFSKNTLIQCQCMKLMLMAVV